MSSSPSTSPQAACWLLPLLLLAGPCQAQAQEHFCGRDTPHPIDVALDAALEGSGGVTADMREAQSTAYAAWDGELNRIYRGVLDATAEPDRARLRAAQRAWLAFHQAESEWLWTDSMHGEEGSSAALTVASLELDRLRERVCVLIGYQQHGEQRAAADE